MRKLAVLPVMRFTSNANANANAPLSSTILTSSIVGVHNGRSVARTRVSDPRAILCPVGKRIDAPGPVIAAAPSGKLVFKRKRVGVFADPFAS